MGKVIRFISLFLLLSACNSGFLDFPVLDEPQEELPGNISIIRLSEQNITQYGHQAPTHSHTKLPPRTGWEYRVGVGDLLNVIVFDHPELTAPAGSGGPLNAFRVQSDGTFFYPFIGQVHAAGRLEGRIRAEMSQKLAEYFPSPQVELRVAVFNSQSISVAGAVRLPKRIALTTIRLNLLEAINDAGGLSEHANSAHIHVKRSGRVYDVDLAAFLRGAADANNPLMRNGDVVFVNRRETQEAYLMGEVGRVAPVDLSTDNVNLTQALARQGGLDEQRADARGIFVFRKKTGGMYVFQLDISSPTGLLLGTNFDLAVNDVVYVVRSPLTRWNDVIAGLLPSIGVIRQTQILTE